MKQLLKKPYNQFKLRRWFRNDLVTYKGLLKNANRKDQIKLFPQLYDKTAVTGFDPHYTYQGPWLFEKILANKPTKHVDIGSQIGYMGFISKFVRTEFVDIRPTNAQFNNFKEIKGSILDLPYKTKSEKSISCLHVIEHIGLGRYGDDLDVDGSIKAIKELQRVVAVGGNIYISVPVGKEITYFNAHRVFNPQTIINLFDGFKLKELSGVMDSGKLVANVPPKRLAKNSYGCGFFWFQRVK